MAEDNQSSAEKSEEPTPKSLEKAREDGDTVRSRELNTTAILMTGAAGILMFGPFMANSLSRVMAYNLSLPAGPLEDSMLLTHFNESVLQALLGLLPFFMLLLVAAILGPNLLGGWNCTFKAITPKASRLNPMSGLARMFGPKALMELLKAVAKVAVVATIALIVLATNTESLLSIQRESAIDAMTHATTVIGWAFLFMPCAMILITAIDIPFQIRQHTQKLKMTMQQVKDEMKDTDGRPEVKQKIKQLQQQVAMNRMMQDLPMADVVITNPDHYSVALRYDQTQESAPRLLAKGVDLVALKIKETANEHEIPIVSAPPLARAIYFNTNIGEEIPTGLYVAVAQVLAYIHQLREWARGKAKKPKLNETYDIPVGLQHE
ncbi:MAG: flagellar biosynthesis protein FlhB [Pseudomonadales bacterium]|nr:flagellar biosynthesis protein FlhB [Pseudomonadales bacterium]